MVKKHTHRKNFLSITSLCLLLLVSMVTHILISPTVNAWGCDEAGRSARADFYSQNNIPSFFDPCESGGTCATGTGSIDGPAPTELKGSEPAEKVWNYFIGRGLTPVAAAGAMGNIEHESGFNPWIGEGGSTSIDPSRGGVGIGLIQWTNTGGNGQGRRYGVMKAMEAAGINLSHVDQNDESQTDTALLVQLNWLWDGEYGKMTWQEQLNKETKVDGDTSVRSMSEKANVGNGSTLYFHAAVERSADSPSMLQRRIDGAAAWLSKFGGGGPDGDCSEGGSTSDVVELAKKVQDGSFGVQKVDGLQGGINGIGCQDCVTFVTTVYVGAGYPKPFAPSNDGGTGITGIPGGNSGDLPGYWSYALSYNADDYDIIPNAEKKPGDILVWYGHVAIFAGGQNSFEGNLGGGGQAGGGHCNIGGVSSLSVDNTLYVLRYNGNK